MNTDSFKTELQQILDNDIALRKEYNDLRRSLNEYRNQLIARDEDCARLQVSIDVLNTKLMVLERDNTSYRQELEGLREQKGEFETLISEKQSELSARQAEIEALRLEIANLSADAEARFEALMRRSSEESAALSQSHKLELEQGATAAAHREQRIREEFEGRLTSVTATWAECEQELMTRQTSQIQELTNNHNEELFLLREQYNNTLSALSTASHEEQAELKVQYETTILALEQKHTETLASLQNQDNTEVLASALDEQRQKLQSEFTSNLEAMAQQYASREDELKQGFETTILSLETALNDAREELNLTMESRLTAIRDAHELLIAQNNQAYESRLLELSAQYEERLANTLIHAQTAGTKLGEELQGYRVREEEQLEQIQLLSTSLNEVNTRAEELKARVGELELHLHNEEERVARLLTEQEITRQSLTAEREECVAELGEQMAKLNHSHSDYVLELTNRITSLNEELANMVTLFEQATNGSAEAESRMDQINSLLESATQRIAELESELVSKDGQLSAAGTDVQAVYEQRIADKELEFRKLLVENNNIITEIEEMQHKLDNRQEEIELLRSEIRETRETADARVAELKDTLDVKNNLIAELEQQRSAFGSQERDEMLEEISVLRATVSSLNADINGLNEKIAELQSSAQTADYAANEAFIDKLFKQIDGLSNQRLALLEEKEQMAAQLLKMNEVVSNLSQQVDSENIDVQNLNSHRKNVILAANSKGDQNAPMKKQINDLVREIDKCIALLSA